jgi:hydroxymethylglutaryl-CoA synthase
MSEQPAVAGVGAYAPRLRIDADTIGEAMGGFEAGGIDAKAVPEADEDALTMGVEAARRALAAAGREGSEVAHLAFATTTPPMAEEDLTARLVSILGVPGGAATRTLTGSTRAGLQALDAALDAGPWGEEAGLVIAADAPRGAPDGAVEHAAGAGAAAFVLAADGPGTVEARASQVTPYPGTRFRPGGSDETTGLGVTQYDRESFRTALSGASGDLGVDPDGVDAAAVQSPDGKLPYRVTDALGVDAGAVAAASTVGDLGDTGAASVPLGVATALEGGADRLLLAGYGSGAGATVMVLSGAVPVVAATEGDTDLSYAEYLRRRGELTSGEPEGGGAYVSVPSWRRTIPQRHRLAAGRCPDCGALNFPPEGACRACHGRGEFEPVALSGEGRIEALTTIAQGGAPPEFVEQSGRSGPFVSAVVELDGPGGETVSLPMQVVTGPHEAAVGAPVETTVRRIYAQEDVIRYGCKAVLTAARR